jgi:hypothetical protein
MAKVESALSLEQILDGIRQLRSDEQRELAAAVLADPLLESFVEELDDSLSCERAAKEGPAEPFAPDKLTEHV